MNLDSFIPLDLEDKNIDLNEDNIVEVFSKILELPGKKELVEQEMVKRLLSGKPITSNDSRSIDNNNTEFNTISDLMGKSYGRLKINNIISEESEGKLCIFLQSQNLINGATHKISIPKEYLIDILNVLFLGKESSINTNVPISSLQESTLKFANELLENIDFMKKRAK